MNTVTVNDLTIAYRALGTGPAVLLLHGWPTSSYLWRNVRPSIARQNRVIALDLPGFGGSDKPLDAYYGFTFFSAAIDGLLDQLGVDRVALAGHDLGGPIAMHWAIRHPDRVTAVAMLNTLLYPDFHPSAIEFVRTLTTPGPREKLTSPDGLAELFRDGLADPAHATDEVIAAVVAPFADEPSRLALAKAGTEMSIRTFGTIADALPSVQFPMRAVYGEQDRLLPDVAETMKRLERDVPGTTVTALPQAGHFVQEDAPDEVGTLLAEFFASILR